MRTTSQLGPRDLVEIMRPTERVASVYIGSASTDTWHARWHRLADQLRCDGADERTIGDLERSVLRESTGATPLVAFTDPAHEPRVFRVPGLAHADLAWFTAPAYVLPVLAWSQDRPPCVVVTTDRAGAVLHLILGGSSAARGLPVHEDARTVATACAAALDQIGARLLVISGDERAAASVEEDLRRLGRGITIRRVPRSAGLQVSQVAAIRRSAARLWTARILSDFTARGHGVEGVRATLDALARGRVEKLLVQYPEDVSATGWFGAMPTDVVAGDGVPPRAWPLRRSGLLADIAVRTAVLGGVPVRVLRAGTPGAPAGGIGGLCRAPLTLVRS